MNKQPTTSKSGALARFFKATFSAGLLAASVLLLSGHTSQAGSATWQTNPGSGDWNTAANWTPMTVPNNPSDTAIFATSDTTNVSLSAPTVVNTVVFGAAASEFTIRSASHSQRFEFFGPGIVNNSGKTQTFVSASPAGVIRFLNSAAAGSDTTFFIEPSPRGGVPSFLLFLGSSSADHGTFLFPELPGGSSPSEGIFSENATAGNANFILDAGFLFFNKHATAGQSHLTFNGARNEKLFGSSVSFHGRSTAGEATLVANGGTNGGRGGIIFITETASGGSARMQVFGNGVLDISGHFAPDTGVGSIEGDGNIFLGKNNLIVGRNGLSTTFFGVIQDGSYRGGGGTGSTLTKVGLGKLVLSHFNTYTGGTVVKQGKLQVNNVNGSGTGSGPVQVNGGRLGGKGIIGGAVTVGTGSGSGAKLAPGYVHGANSPGALTIQSNLTFNSDATYEVGMNSSSAMADEVVALGVTINGGARFAFVDLGSGTLPAGTVFTVINNTAATPIAGTFSNLPDGATFTSNGNSFKADYQGGNGNDLTLRVVP